MPSSDVEPLLGVGGAMAASYANTSHLPLPGNM
jgi:hypothetical protein